METGNPKVPDHVRRAKHIRCKIAGSSGTVEGDNLSEESEEVQAADGAKEDGANTSEPPTKRQKL